MAYKIKISTTIMVEEPLVLYTQPQSPIHHFCYWFACALSKRIHFFFFLLTNVLFCFTQASEDV